MARELEWIRRTPQGRQVRNQARISAYESMVEQDGKQRESQVEIYVPPGPRLGDVVIEAEQVSKSMGDTVLMDKVTFSIPPGAIVGVVGPNGAGKTTLLRMLLGELEPDGGTLRLGDTVVTACAQQGRDALPDELTVWEAISQKDEEIDLGGEMVEFSG